MNEIRHNSEERLPVLAAQPWKRCVRCLDDLPLCDFGKSYKSADGHRNVCVTCHEEGDIPLRKPARRLVALIGMADSNTVDLLRASFLDGQPPGSMVLPTLVEREVVVILSERIRLRARPAGKWGRPSPGRAVLEVAWWAGVRGSDRTGVLISATTGNLWLQAEVSGQRSGLAYWVPRPHLWLPVADVPRLDVGLERKLEAAP